VFASLLVTPIVFGQVSLTTAQIARRVSPSVVVIQGKTESGDFLGSGFIISKNGRIITNLHVIRDMKTAIVRVANGEIFDSLSVLAVDERRDIAVVQIPGFNLPPLELGDSDVLTVGEPLVVVGTPRGLEGTVTAGILSSVRDSGEGFKVLQTDAGVNPGNSGGPLLNNKGQVIGVVAFKLKSSEGLNFAIPINYVRGLLNNVHEPMTLNQMRQGLTSDKTEATQDTTEPSLKAILDSLKGNLAQEVFNFVAPFGSETWTVSQSSTLDSESCAPAFDTHIKYKTGASPDWSPLVTVLRVKLPLREILSGAVTKGEPYPNITSGDKVSYNVVLRTTPKGVVLLETLGQPETTTDVASLPFHEESAAQRALALALHARDLCRKPGPEPTVTGPSLKETLEWLKENIPLGTLNYLSSPGGSAVSMNEQSAVYSLDSCTATLGRVVTLTIADRPQRQSVGSYRATVPLGAISDAFVVSMDSLGQDAKVALGSGGGYRVILMSKSKNILLANYPPNSQRPITEAADGFFLKFSDESMANRVVVAFEHAADLCRKKEPF
jgi:S1-C subfamily serine protease